MKGFFACLKGAQLKPVMCVCVCVYRDEHHRYLRVAWPHLFYKENFRVGGELKSELIMQRLKRWK